MGEGGRTGKIRPMFTTNHRMRPKAGRNSLRPRRIPSLVLLAATEEEEEEENRRGKRRDGGSLLGGLRREEKEGGNPHFELSLS